MRVRLEDIPPEGLEVAFEDTRLKPGDLGEQVVEVLEAPRAELRLLRQGDRVRAQGSYRARLTLVCSRCLVGAPFDLTGEIDWQFLPEAQAAKPGGGKRSGAEEVHLQENELEAVFYQKGELDLGKVLKDELALELPMAPLCRPDCAGLCPECGKPKAEGGCDCLRRETDPRWAALAKLKE